MKFIEHRRHSIYTIPYPHLNQQGVDLARDVGARLGPFNLVITSSKPRAFETAIAMGFAVDQTLKEISGISSTIDQEIAWDAGFQKFAETYEYNGATSLWAKGLAKIFLKIVRKLPENGAALIISHGGIVEGSTIGNYPDFDYTNWNRSVGYCEGVLLSFENDKCISAKYLEVHNS
jgi:broad specificity phosphatase PhoE